MKASIYIDRELWRRFREYARRKGAEISEFLESVIEDAMLEESVASELGELAGEDTADETDFEPVETEAGSVSDLVRVMRDECARNIPQ